MQHTSGEFKGYFAWQMKTDGSKISGTPAADGEEYFATSLLFAQRAGEMVKEFITITKKRRKS